MITVPVHVKVQQSFGLQFDLFIGSLQMLCVKEVVGVFFSFVFAKEWFLNLLV